MSLHPIIKRPIALSNIFLALLIVGVIIFLKIPIQLMPNIDIPQISILSEVDDYSATEINEIILHPLKEKLQRIEGVNAIKCISKQGKGSITIETQYGIELDYTFIEVNEIIDQTMLDLPRNIARPIVQKHNISDLPVIFLHINSDFYKLEEVSNIARNQIKRRIEQLQEVAYVNVNGTVSNEIIIVPNESRIKNLGISIQEIKEVLQDENQTFGTFKVLDKGKMINISFSNELHGISDLESTYITTKNGQTIQLRSIATVREKRKKENSIVIINNKQGISLGIVQQQNVQLTQLKIKLNEVLSELKTRYPKINFSTSRDQSILLNYTINNLFVSLFVGISLSFLVLFLFINNFKSPLLIGISMPVSIIISIIFFHLFKISINIISLSGILLGVGMMIDNSIIVIDNIEQHFLKNKSSLSVAIATKEVFFPILSGVLTTCAVFFPMILLEGIAGTLFYDQALSIGIGLFSSLIVSITLLPCYYFLFHKKRKITLQETRLMQLLFKVYHSMLVWTFRKPILLFLPILALIIGGLWSLDFIEKRKLPLLPDQEYILEVSWNDNINIYNNKNRIKTLSNLLSRHCTQIISDIGESKSAYQESSIEINQDFTSMYLHLNEFNNKAKVHLLIDDFFAQYPKAIYKLMPAPNVFNKIFPSNEFPLIAKIYSNDHQNKVKALEVLHQKYHFKTVVKEEFTHLKIDTHKLRLFNVKLSSLKSVLNKIFKQNHVLSFYENNAYTPVYFWNDNKFQLQSLEYSYVASNEDKLIPVNTFITKERRQDFKYVYADQKGEYIPIFFSTNNVSEARAIIAGIPLLFKENKNIHVDFEGDILDLNVTIKELLLVGIISILLLYLILTAQFESFTLPIIILLEVPIDIAGALITLHLFGSSINVMSILGMILMSGIIINDSILKIETINQYFKDGHGLLKSIFLGGTKRLKSIIMTTVTTILSIIGLFFGDGLGIALQSPLALTILGGMTTGVLVSLFFIPTAFYYLKK